MTARVPLHRQITEVDRELRMRAEVYPRMVSNGKMRRGEAEFFTEHMQAVKRSLEFLQANEDFIKRCIRQREAVENFLAGKDEDAVRADGEGG